MSIETGGVPALTWIQLLPLKEWGAVKAAFLGDWNRLWTAIRARIASEETASIGGGALLAGVAATGTTTVVGARVGMAVLTTPATYPGAGFVWQSYVSADDTVVTKVLAVVNGTPTATTYYLRLVK